MTNADDVTRALTILTEMPREADGTMLGCTSYLQRKMNLPYSVVWDIIDALVGRGVLTETDGHGRRKLVTPGG